MFQLTGNGPIRLSKSRFGVGEGLPVLGSVQLVILFTWSIKNIRPLSEYEKSQPGGNAVSVGFGLTPTSFTRVPVVELAFGVLLLDLLPDPRLRGVLDVSEFVLLLLADGLAVAVVSEAAPLTGPTKSSNGWSSSLNKKLD